jgi:hypothetical protein
VAGGGEAVVAVSKAQLATTWNEHTPSGAHRSRRVPFPQWVPDEVKEAALKLSVPEAEKILASTGLAKVRASGRGKP